MARHVGDGVFSRVAIMGNGGSGKTWLAKRLALCLERAPVHLDDVYWQPERFGSAARDKAVVAEEVRRLSRAPEWLVEGVYGWLIDVLVPRTSLLIFLDLPEDECVANVKARGKQYRESDENFAELIDWVSKYRQRVNNWNSFEAHQRLFNEFQYAKVRLRSRTEISAYADRLSSN
ncbi:AAA family ATPase [Neorhizobium sp. NCHU2750]|uniref:AAA family ATPase n=1 Tax=Neorhizobium sp. NCHU2750 TaxID=1825976 RepID=UPI000E72507A|nr:topology modulation protein [Neorhizobium sp. NCHU2750]